MRGTIFILALSAIGSVACDGPDPDRALYRRAHEVAQNGGEAEARALYQQLLRPDGGSRLTAEAHVALAELDFAKGDFDAALAHYREVVALAGPTRPYALYKQGWCWLNKNEPAKAMEAFEAVAALPAGPGFPEERRQAIAREARRDLAKTYALSDRPFEEAAGYLERLGGSESPELLERLAEAYAEKGRWREAAAIFRDLLATHVSSPLLCEWQWQIVRATLSTGTRREQLAETQRLAAVLARLESTHALATTVTACRNKLRDITKEQMLLWHKSAQKNHDTELATLADPLYRQYLARFSKEKDAAELAYYHGDLLWTLERWIEAHDEYVRVLELEPHGKFRKEAAYGAVLAAKNALEAEPTRAPAKGLTPQPFSIGEQRLLAAFDRYLAHVPDGEVVPVKYRRARLHYEHNQFATAIPLFQELVEHHPGSELAIYSANLVLDSQNALRKTKDVCAYVAKLLAGPLPARDAQANREWRKLASQCERSSGSLAAP
jgi:tetratricopeptide (TPR) repeat protein